MRKNYYCWLFCCFLLSSINAFSQQVINVTGTVKESNGSAVAAASIKLLGSQKGTISDENGNFLIKAAVGSTLQVEAIGYIAQNIEVTGEQHIDIILTAANADSSLNDVVVTALGVRKSTKSLGYSVATVNHDQLTQARVTNIANGLDGLISGLQINTVNNGVNPQTRIVLRGERSILGNNQAAIVINNLPVSSSILSYLNPDDINSVTVLKGANAAGLYGSQASNGVIMIETNKGSTNGKPKIGFTHTTTLEKVAYFPKLQSQFGAASTEGQYYNPLTGYFNNVPYENQQYGPEFNGQLLPLGPPVQYINPAGQVVDTQQYALYSNRNAIKGFFNTGVTNQDGISYADGDDNGSFYLSAQYVKDKGTIPDDKSERTTITFGGAKKYGRFSANASFTYTRFNTNTAGAGFDPSQARPVYWNVLNTPGNIDLNWYKDPNGIFSNPSSYYNDYYPNPWWQIQNSRVINQTDEYFGTAELNFKAADWANFTYRIGLDAEDYQNTTSVGAVSFTDYAISDPGGGGNIASSNPNGFDASVADNFHISSVVQSDLLGTFTHNFFNDNLGAKLILGGSVYKSYDRYSDISAAQLQIPGLYNVSNVIGVPGVDEGTIDQGSFGLYGDLQLNYKTFLYAEVTGRNDWVSVLAPQNRSFFYPGVNGSFVFTDAFKGIKNALPWLDLGKITASWTKVGNVDVGPYQLANTFSQTSGFPYGNLTGFTMGTTLANENLKPEFTASQEYGIHLAMFKDRLNAEATYYMEKTTNETVPVDISSATGYNNTLQNVGLLHNSGWEFDLDATPLLNLGPVEWNLSANLSLNNSKVDSITSGLNSIFIGGLSAGSGVYTITGGPIRQLMVTDWERDAQGQVIVDPNTGYPTADPTLKSAGRATPHAILGLNTSFKYKGLTLGIIAEYRGGYNVLNNIGNAMAFTGTSAITASAGRGKFIYPNSVIQTGTDANGNPVYTKNTSVAIQDGATGNGFWPTIYNTVESPFVTSGDFWEIQEVSLSYSIPLKHTNVIKKLSVGFVARNLFTWLPKDNPYASPEYSDFGTGNAQGFSDENLSPPTRIFGGTVNIVF